MFGHHYSQHITVHIIIIIILFLQSCCSSDLSLGSVLVQLSLGLLLQSSDVIHGHPVPLVRPTEQLKCCKVLIKSAHLLTTLHIWKSQRGILTWSIFQCKNLFFSQVVWITKYFKSRWSPVCGSWWTTSSVSCGWSPPPWSAAPTTWTGLSPACRRSSLAHKTSKIFQWTCRKIFHDNKPSSLPLEDLFQSSDSCSAWDPHQLCSHWRPRDHWLCLCAQLVSPSTFFLPAHEHSQSLLCQRCDKSPRWCRSYPYEKVIW